MNESKEPRIDTIQKKRSGILIFSFGFGVGFVSGLITFLIGIIIIGTMAESIAQNSMTASNDDSYQSSQASAERPTMKLSLISTNSYFEAGYAIVEGQVKNTGNEKIDNIEVIVTWKTKEGEFIKSDSAMIDYDPIMGQQTSPFKVLTTRNPKMLRYEIDFKQALGGSIDWVDMRKKSK